MLTTYLDWSTFKTKIVNKNKLRYTEKPNEFYTIFYHDSAGIFESSIILDSGADQTDFDTNYKSYANTAVDNPNDADSTMMVRPKAAKLGWTYHLTAPEFETSVVNSLHHKDYLGNDLGEVTLKFYDINSNELTTQASCDTDCVETHLIFEPTWDYEVIGGTIKSISTVTQDVRVWVVAVPDIPAGSGGSKVMVQGINLKFIDPNNGVEADGRVAKYMTYNATYHTNKLKLIVKHPAGHKEKLTIMFEVFKQ